ncbi:MAG: hypothetical protein ACO35C_07175 [Pontimonas sp.]
MANEKRIPKDDSMQVLHIRVPAKIKMDLIVISQKTGHTINDHVNNAIRQYLSKINRI